MSFNEDFPLEIGLDHCAEIQVTRGIGPGLIMTDNIIMKISPSLSIHNFFISSNFMLTTNYTCQL